MKTLGVIALASLLATVPALPAAFAQEHPKQAEHPQLSERPVKAGDIVAVATAAGSFKTLVAAIEAAGLTAKLQGEGPFTVFAPTDEAFAKLPAGTLENLLKPENKEKLAGLLACHVLPGRIMAADVKTMKAATVSGQDVNIKVEQGNVTVGGAMVVKADVMAANGVIHVVDAVVLADVPADAGTAGRPKDHPAH
ncbi:MAG: fasciclin domain-containing protein [Krumholzibacteria bacterium]|nr:fasciclin domain-containing protein [Candidatus Krumholzibacteria bacterium]